MCRSRRVGRRRRRSERQGHAGEEERGEKGASGMQRLRRRLGFDTRCDFRLLLFTLFGYTNIKLCTHLVPLARCTPANREQTAPRLFILVRTHGPSLRFRPGGNRRLHVVLRVLCPTSRFVPLSGPPSAPPHPSSRSITPSSSSSSSSAHRSTMSHLAYDAASMVAHHLKARQ